MAKPAVCGSSRNYDAEERDALAAYDELHGAGYDARIQPIQGEQYQLRITQLPSRAEAQALARELTGKMGITAPTAGR
ncbi:MAG: SPOR domain-containing protein [Betaproteobacteria bacterium]|nr:SPOR domain-containing protein [Betaproteobacteria bacterium]MDE2309637.1 SPOR domain-containing protein [Betaproteobacteria bacterium]